MVRTYVRTLTLNVYRVEDESMLRFIRDKTCAPYFGNLVWFMGKHVLELDASARARPVDVDTQKTIQYVLFINIFIYFIVIWYKHIFVISFLSSFLI